MPLRSNLAFKSEFPICSICNEFIELETTKVDEVGKPVHEQCCVQQISLKKSTRPPPTKKDAEYKANPRAQAIIALLKSANTDSVMNSCPDCGSFLEYRGCTFSHEGQTWESILPVCIHCDSISHVLPPHDA